MIRRIIQPMTRLSHLSSLALRCVAITLLLVVALLVRGEPAIGLEREDRQRALLATVQVVVPDESGIPTSAGSGTVLDAAQGLILTNYHVIGDRLSSTWFNRDGIAVIGVNPPNLRGVPVFRYYAQVVKADAEMDLALLRVFAPFEDINGALPANLGLTAVDRGSSNALEIGDPIYVLGFPGLGGDTVTYTEGIVSGFLDEDRNGVEEWIKTDAEVNHGNSGGLAVDDAGDFVGVPSAGYTDAESAGKISLIRPGDLALTYYDAWTVSSPTPGTQIGTKPIESNEASQIARVENVQFGASIDDAGKVIAPAVRFPSGTSALYASFDFRNIARSDPFAFVWSRAGEKIDAGSVSRGRRESGSEWLSLESARGLADGVYQLELSAGTQTLYQGNVQIGDAAQANPGTIGALLFAAGVNEDGAAIGAATSFANIGEVFGLFDASQLREGALVRTLWFYEGAQVLEDVAPWTGNGVPVGWVSIMHPDGLPVGAYSLEIYIEGALAQRGDFAVIERAQAQTYTVQVVGEVTDADNSRRKVNGALIVALRPGATSQDWVDAEYDESMIYASANSNRSGEYQLSADLAAGQAYTIIAVQDDYFPVVQENYLIPANATSPHILNISMQRR